MVFEDRCGRKAIAVRYPRAMPDTTDALLDLLAAQPGLAQHEIARRLRVSVRTVRRRLRPLVGDGTVLVTPDGTALRYELGPGARRTLPLPALSEVEAEALTVAALAAQAVLAPTPYAAPLARAREALCQTWVRDVFAFEPETEAEHWSFDGAAGGEAPESALTALGPLVRATRDRRPVEAVYYTARSGTRSRRRLHPLGVFVRSGSWLLAAWCVRSAMVKDFALGGFEAVDVDNADTFEPPPGFSLAGYVRDRFGAMSGDDVVEVRLLVEAAVAESFRRKQHHPTQQVEPAADGRAEVSLEVEGLASVLSWVLSYGAGVVVLAPDDLAARVAAAHRAAAARYPDPR